MSAVIGMSKFVTFYTCSVLVSKNMSPLQITCRMKPSSLSWGPLCSSVVYISPLLMCALDIGNNNNSLRSFLIFTSPKQCYLIGILLFRELACFFSKQVWLLFADPCPQTRWVVAFYLICQVRIGVQKEQLPPPIKASFKMDDFHLTP